VSRHQFCDDFLNLVMNRDKVNRLLMSNEAHFGMSGYVNEQNCSNLAPNNSHELYQRPLHRPKVIVWCAISSRGIACPCFFETAEARIVTVNAERHRVMLRVKAFLRNELCPRQLDLL
jgi:hypothetical protein